MTANEAQAGNEAQGGSEAGTPRDPDGLSAGDVAVVITRLLQLLTVDARPEVIRDVSVEASVHGDTPGAWTDRIETACRGVGIPAREVRGTLAALLPTLGPSQPLITMGTLGEERRLLLLTDHRGSKVQVETAATDEPTWMEQAQLASAMGVAPEQEALWLVLDAPLPSAATADGGAHPSHPDPRTRLWSWLRLERHDVLTVLVYAVFVGLLTLTTPIAVQALVNTVAFGTLLQPLVVLSLLLFLALAFAATLRGLQYWVVEVIQRRLFVRVVSDLSRRLPRVRRDSFDGHDGAELANRFFDVVTLQKAASSLLLDGLEIVLTVGVGMLVLAFYHPFLFAFDLVLIAAIFVVAWLGRRGPSTAVDESKLKYEIAAWLEELARHDVAFKLGGGLDYAEIRADGLLRSWLAARSAHYRVVLRQFVLVLAMQALAGACILGIGGWLVIERQLTLGQLVAAELIVTVVVASVAKLGKYLEIYYDLLAGIDKLGHLVDLPTEREGGSPCRPVNGEARGIALVAEGLVAGYDTGPDVLRGASFTLQAGSRNALVGGDGSGKSLLVELVAAMREPRRGRLSVDGWDSRALELRSLRSRMAVVRTAAILPASVLENVRMGRPEVDVQRVRDVLADVGMLDCVDRLPDGIHSQLSGVGEPLSPGERARIVVARAIAARPSLLVVDDALDGLQPSLRGQIFQMLCRPDQPWTLLVISDDPQLHGLCDQVLLLERGLVRDDMDRPSLIPGAPR